MNDQNQSSNNIQNENHATDGISTTIPMEKDAAVAVASTGVEDASSVVSNMTSEQFDSKEAANIPASSPVPTVVIPQKNGLPFWFYILFVATLIVFIAMTTLLVLSFAAKKSNPSKTTTVPTQVVNISPSVIAPSVASVTTLDSAETLTSSDKTADILTDLENTNLQIIKDNLDQLDSQLSFTSRN